LRSLQPLPEKFAQVHILKRLHPCYIDELWIAFEFNEVIRLLLHGIKYQKMPRLGMRIGEYASETFRNRITEVGESLVLPIPLHTVRKKEREYNQSSYIARGIFEETEASIIENLLIRKRYTASQTKLNRIKRKLNVKDAFSLIDASIVKDNIVVLVDDVVTTGATMNECARLLKENGAGKIIGVALATPVEGE
jgi:ComF family protein